MNLTYHHKSLITALANKSKLGSNEYLLLLLLGEYREVFGKDYKL